MGGAALQVFRNTDFSRYPPEEDTCLRARAMEGRKYQIELVGWAGWVSWCYGMGKVGLRNEGRDYNGNSKITAERGFGFGKKGSGKIAKNLSINYFINYIYSNFRSFFWMGIVFVSFFDSFQTIIIQNGIS